MSKMRNLIENPKIVEKAKFWFIVPACVVVLAIIMGVVFGFTKGSPVNLSMDFAGGYSITLRLSTRLDDESYPMYQERINEIAENLTDENDNKFGLKISDMQRQGEDESASILIRYMAIKPPEGQSEIEFMKTVNERFEEELKKLFVYLPDLGDFAGESKTLTAVYKDPIMPAIEVVIKGNAEKLKVPNRIVSLTKSEDNKTLTIEFTNNISTEDALSVLTVEDVFSGEPTKGNSTSAVMSRELVVNAVLAILLALTLMMVYIVFRFEVSSGVAAIIALVHDIIIMLAFMVIFNIEIGASFIAALITILGYSINNTIILFDRVREKQKPLKGTIYDPYRLANDAVRDTFKRSLFTTITTLIPITMIALIGVASIRIFALPIIIGLLAGTFSSVCLAPSVWAMWKRKLFSRKGKKADADNDKPETAGPVKPAEVKKETVVTAETD